MSTGNLRGKPVVYGGNFFSIFFIAFLTFFSTSFGLLMVSLAQLLYTVVSDLASIMSNVRVPSRRSRASFTSVGKGR